MKAFLQKDGEIYPDRVVSGVDAVRMNLRDRLSIVKGEYLQNVMLGVPLGARKEELDLNVQQIILGTSGVLGITSFSSKFVDKIYRCRFSADTVFGGLMYE